MGLCVEFNVQIDPKKLSATVCVGLWVWHVNNSNRVVRPVDVAKVGIQNVYRTRYKNYEVMKLSTK